MKIRKKRNKAGFDFECAMVSFSKVG